MFYLLAFGAGSAAGALALFLYILISLRGQM